MTHLRAQPSVRELGACVISIPFVPAVSQQHGYFHGSVVGALADAAGAYAGFTLLPTTSTILTVECKIKLIAPARAGDVPIVAEIGRAALLAPST